MYLKAPQTTKIRLYNNLDQPMFKEEDTSVLCKSCGRPKIAPEPLYTDFTEWMLGRFTDPKLIEELKGAEQMELMLRVRAIIKAGPDRGVYAFESADGKRVKNVIVDPTGGYHAMVLHNFAEFIQCGVDMSDKDPRAILAVVPEPPQTHVEVALPAAAATEN